MLDRIRSTRGDSGTGDSRGGRLSRSLSGTNLARAGDYNQRTVLQAIRLAPGITRVEIAEQTGLTAPTIANITSRLVDLDLIRVTGRRQGGRGQPALRLEVAPDGAFSIGLNIDRDHLSLVVVDLAGSVRSRVTREHAWPLPGDVVAFVRDELAPALEAGGVDRSRVLGAGVALPDELGRIALPHRPATYDQWLDIDPAELLAPVLPWPIHTDNDAAAAALGEAEYGTAFNNPSFVYLLVSAGLGGGVVVDRSYHRGANARSGEIGLMPDPTSDRPGAMIQDTVSLSALLDRLGDAGFTVGVEQLADLNGAAAAVVDQWLADAVRSLVQPLIAINCLINPDAVLIGGRLPLPLIERLAADLNRELASVPLPARAPVMPADMAQDAPAIGAAILPLLAHLLPSDAILIQAGR